MQIDRTDAAPAGPLARARWPARLVAVAVAVLLVFGMALRLQGLDGSPLHFQVTRQLHTAIIARAMYLDRTEPASDRGRIAADEVRAREQPLEAPITEEVLATLYQAIGHESLWLAGAFESVVWLAGGLVLFALLRRLTTPIGAIGGLAVDVMVPLGVAGGRSLQPDPLMVTLILATALAVVAHHERPTRGRLVVAGALAGAATLVKITALPVVALLWLAFVAARAGWRAVASRDSLAFAALALTPTVLALAVGFAPSVRDRSEDYFVPSLLLRRSFYGDWFGLVGHDIGAVVVVLAALGLVVSRGTARRLLATFVVAYLVLVVLFDYRMATHGYYHLVLVPILALGCGLALGEVPALLQRGPRLLARGFVPLAAVAAVAAGALAYLAVPSYPSDHPRVAAIHAAAAVTGRGATVASVTPDYGRTLAYYGELRVIAELPGPEDRTLLELQHRPVPSFAEFLAAARPDWVVVTFARKLHADPEAERELTRHYRLAGHGRGWMVFDVRHRH